MEINSSYGLDTLKFYIFSSMDKKHKIITKISMSDVRSFVPHSNEHVQLKYCKIRHFQDKKEIGWLIKF